MESDTIAQIEASCWLICLMSYMYTQSTYIYVRLAVLEPAIGRQSCLLTQMRQHNVYEIIDSLYFDELDPSSFCHAFNYSILGQEIQGKKLEG